MADEYHVSPHMVEDVAQGGGDDRISVLAKAPVTPFQLEASANAPCSSTMVGFASWRARVAVVAPIAVPPTTRPVMRRVRLLLFMRVLVRNM
jgi:hypothetical protein